MTFVDEQLDDILEKVLEESGGLGKLQWLLIFVINGSRLAITWGIFMMTFAGSTPDWWCVSQNGTSGLNDDRLESLRSCSPLVNTPGGYSCLSIRFSKEKNTIVNEWSLICGKEWITSIITTMQFVGLLTSGFIAGQVADLIGRKPTLLLSLTLLAASNLLCAFSSSWEMFAIARFLIGLACGMFLTVYLNFVLEFIPTTYRAMIMAIDTCPINAALLGLVSFWLKDWRYLHFATFLITLPFLLGMIMVPESFRWLVSHFKTEKAKEVIEKIAIINGKERTDVTKLIAIIQKETEEVVKKSYSILDIFRDTTLTKHSFLLWFIWLSTGYSYFAISFGVEELSGDLYLNIILLSLVEIPVQLVTWYLNNRIGRRWTCFMFYLIAAGGGSTVGSIQIFDAVNSPVVNNLFAMMAKLGVAAAWAALKTFTTETYPTVVRNIGYGCAISISGVGAMVAPQIVQMSKSFPGLMYSLCGGLMFLSAITAVLVPDTKGKIMENKI